MTVIPTVVVYNHFAEFDTTVTSLETVMQVAQLQLSYQSQQHYRHYCTSLVLGKMNRIMNCAALFFAFFLNATLAIMITYSKLLHATATSREYIQSCM